MMMGRVAVVRRPIGAPHRPARTRTPTHTRSITDARARTHIHIHAHSQILITLTPALGSLLLITRPYPAAPVPVSAPLRPLAVDAALIPPRSIP